MVQEFDYIDHLAEKLGYYTGYFLVKGAKIFVPKISYAFASLGFLRYVVRACDNTELTSQELFERCVDASIDAY